MPLKIQKSVSQDSLQKSYLPIPQSVVSPRPGSGFRLSLTPHPDHIQRGEGEPKGPLGLCHRGRASLEEVSSRGRVWNPPAQSISEIPRAEVATPSPEQPLG